MKILLVIFCFLFNQVAEAQINIYLIPGQGADERLFSNLSFDSNYVVRHIRYFTPEKGTDMKTYARQPSAQIDTTKPFVLMGTSLEGMLACEMTDFLKPQKVIIISSTKCRDELPSRYKFMDAFPLYKVLPRRMVKGGARMMQPVVVPDCKKNEEIFKSMLKAKDLKFMKLSVKMIINWEREKAPENVIHIHGTEDHTLPIRKVKPNYTIENGSHMMTLTQGSELSSLLKEIL